MKNFVIVIGEKEPGNINKKTFVVLHFQHSLERLLISIGKSVMFLSKKV